MAIFQKNEGDPTWMSAHFIAHTVQERSLQTSLDKEWRWNDHPHKIERSFEAWDEDWFHLKTKEFLPRRVSYGKSLVKEDG